MNVVIPFRAITTTDPDASKVIPLKITGCSRISVAADSNAKGAKLTFRLVFRDSLNNPVGTTAPITLVASQAADWGELFLASDASGTEPTFNCIGDLAYIQVTKLEPPDAKWNLGADAR